MTDSEREKHNRNSETPLMPASLTDVLRLMTLFSPCGEDIPMLRGCGTLEAGTGFRIEIEKTMDAYERVIPFLRNAIVEN